MATRCAALLAAVGAAAAQPTTLEIYYSTTCPNCLAELQDNVIPLLDAGLPGDQLMMTVLPWLDDRPVIVSAHLCSLRGAIPSGDSATIQPGVKFLACDLVNLIEPDAPDRTLETAQSCAAQAGVAWDGPDGVRTCHDNRTGVMLLHSSEYVDQVNGANSRIVPRVRAPFLFLDGKLMHCPGSAFCDQVWDDASQAFVALERPGTLLEIVCSKRPEPLPAACAPQAEATPAPANQELDPNCPNCFEVGKLRWSLADARRGPSLLAAGAFLLLLSVVGAGVALAARRSRREERQPSRRQPLQESLDAEGDVARPLC